MQDVVIGIDFGTTNSSIACADPNSTVRLAKFPLAGGLSDAYRSLLYLEQIMDRHRRYRALPHGRPQGPADSVLEIVSKQPQSSDYRRVWSPPDIRGPD